MKISVLKVLMKGGVRDTKFMDNLRGLEEKYSGATGFASEGVIPSKSLIRNCKYPTE